MTMAAMAHATKEIMLMTVFSTNVHDSLDAGLGPSDVLLPSIRCSEVCARAARVASLACVQQQVKRVRE